MEEPRIGLKDKPFGKKEKLSKDPREWPGYEEKHSLAVGTIVKWNHFGRTELGEVTEHTFSPTFDLPTYTLKSGGRTYPYIGLWKNTNAMGQITEVVSTPTNE